MPLKNLTKGRVLSTSGSTVVFKPAASTYELHLTNLAGPYTGPIDAPVTAVLRGTARKVYTVPSGGLFVTPILGPTRVIQGRVTDLAEGELSVQAVVTINVALPKTPGAVELARGPIGQGTLVSVTLQPGATFELASALEPAHTTALTPPAAPVE